MAAVYGEHSVCMQIISKTYRYFATIKGSEADNLPDVLQQLCNLRRLQIRGRLLCFKIDNGNWTEWS